MFMTKAGCGAYIASVDRLTLNLFKITLYFRYIICIFLISCKI